MTATKTRQLQVGDWVVRTADWEPFSASRVSFVEAREGQGDHRFERSGKPGYFIWPYPTHRLATADEIAAVPIVEGDQVGLYGVDNDSPDALRLFHVPGYQEERER